MISVFSLLLYSAVIFFQQASANPNIDEGFSIYNDSWAVVIGINKYEKTRNLNYAVQDAESIKAMLIEDYKFPESNIKMLTDGQATKDGIRESINDVIEKAGEDDQVLIFFAGHGETDDLPSGGEMGYLLPVKADPDKLYLTALPMSEIKAISNMTNARHVLFLIDACYGGLATIDARGVNPSTPGYLDKITRSKARQIITAGSKGEEVIERPEWGHSAFTRNILRGLENLMADYNDDGAITTEELGVYIKDKVTIDSDQLQTPQIRRFESGDGEFVFAYKGNAQRTAMSSSQSKTEITLDYKKLAQEIVTEQLKQETIINFKDIHSDSDPALEENPSTEDEMLYFIDKRNELLATKDEYIALLESDTVKLDDKITYISNYTKNKLKQEYNLSFAGKMGFNRVDGIYLVPGIYWEAPKPHKIAVGLRGGYSFAVKIVQYKINLDYNWIKNDNFLFKTSGSLYDETYTYDHWLGLDIFNSMWYSSQFGIDLYDYFRNYGFSVNLKSENINKETGKNSFFSLEYFNEIHSPLRKNTDFASIPNKETIRENIYHPDSMSVTKLSGINLYPPSLNKTYDKDHKETFFYSPEHNFDTLNVYLIAESKNWPKKRYKMDYVSDGYEVKIKIFPSMYYYRFLVDTLLITDPDSKNNKTISSGDSVSVRNVGSLINSVVFKLELGSASIGKPEFIKDTTFIYSKSDIIVLLDYHLNPYNEIRLRYISKDGVSPLPFTKYTYAGGIGSLRGYAHKEFNGGSVNIINLEYQKTFFPSLLYNYNSMKGLHSIGLIMFYDWAKIYSYTQEDFSWNQILITTDNTIYKSSIGCGFSLNGIRIFAAKRMDRDKNDWSFVLEFGTIRLRNYNIPH